MTMTKFVEEKEEGEGGIGKEGDGKGWRDGPGLLNMVAKMNIPQPDDDVFGQEAATALKKKVIFFKGLSSCFFSDIIQTILKKELCQCHVRCWRLPLARNELWSPSSLEIYSPVCFFFYVFFILFSLLTCKIEMKKKWSFLVFCSHGGLE